MPQIRSIAFGIGTYDLKIHAGNPQNILWLILQQNAPGYCAFRWRESPLSGMNALMDFNSKHKHEATPGRWKSASKVFQGVAVDVVIYEQMNWFPMVFHQSRVWAFEGLRLAPMASYCRSEQVMVWCLGSLVWNHRICLQGESLWGIPRIVVIGWLELWSPATPNTLWEGASKPDRIQSEGLCLDTMNPSDFNFVVPWIRKAHLGLLGL